MITEGRSDPIGSYFSANQFLTNAREVLKKCYYKVRFQPTVAFNDLSEVYAFFDSMQKRHLEFLRWNNGRRLSTSQS